MIIEKIKKTIWNLMNNSFKCWKVYLHKSIGLLNINLLKTVYKMLNLKKYSKYHKSMGTYLNKFTKLFYKTNKRYL